MRAAMVIALLAAAPVLAQDIVWPKQCRVHRGCPKEKLLPICKSGLSPVTLRDALAAREEKKALVYARLATGYEEMEQPRGRCGYKVRKPLVLREGDGDLLLEGLRCSGDESQVCCPHTIGEIVLAEGKLRKVASPITPATEHWTMKGARLCRLPPSPLKLENQ